MVRLSEKAKSSLHAWVVSTLASFYKADKNSLATYVTALVDAADAVRHAEFKSDLTDFLGAHTDAFVRELSEYVKKLAEDDGPAAAAGGGGGERASSDFKSSSSSRSRRDDRDRSRRGRSRSRSRSPPSKRRTYQPQQPPPNYAPPPFRPSAAGVGGAPVSKPKADHSKTTSIIVAEIPRHQCDLRVISGFFSRFGPVVACRVDPDTMRATVSYGDPQSAKAAISSSLPVLNNRFIKIYWDTSNSIPLADVPAKPTALQSSFPAPIPASPVPVATGAASASEPSGPSAADRYQAWQEMQKNEQQLREVQQQRETLRKKQLSEIASMTVMLGSATGKKREFLMKQIEELTALVQASLKPDQERLGVVAGTGTGYEKQLSQAVAVLEMKAGEMGLMTKVYKRKKADSGPSRVLDNRPRQLLLGNLPETATVKSTLMHFKTFGLIDEIDLESAEKTITFAVHEGASKALVHGGNFKDDRGGIVKLALSYHTKPEVLGANAVAAVAAAVAAPPSVKLEVGEKPEDEEEEDDGTQKNWKR